MNLAENEGLGSTPRREAHAPVYTLYAWTGSVPRTLLVWYNALPRASWSRSCSSFAL